MLTSDDLKKIQGVVEKVVDKRADELELKMELRFNTVEKRFDNRFDKIEKQMEEDRKDWSEFFNQAGIFFDEMRNQLSKRIKKLEDNQRISKN